jgi:hypothetical protein
MLKCQKTREKKKYQQLQNDSASLKVIENLGFFYETKDE